MELWLKSPFDRFQRSASKDSVFEWVKTLRGEVFRSVDQRFTARFEEDGRGYFVKYHRGLSLGEFFKNIICLRWPVAGARDEWIAVEHLQQHGVGTMTPVAFGERGCLPFWQESFLITEELAGCESLGPLTDPWAENPPELALKRHLIGLVADSVSGMHRSGLNHRDCYLCHFLWNREADTLHVIDLHRAQIRDKVPKRWVDKDLGALYTSASGIGLTRLDFFRFLRAYHGGRIDREEVRRLLPQIEKRARKIRAHTESLKRRRGFT